MTDADPPRCPDCEGPLAETGRSQDPARLEEWDAVEWIEYRCRRCRRRWRDDLRRCMTVLLSDKRGSRR